MLQDRIGKEKESNQKIKCDSKIALKGQKQKKVLILYKYKTYFQKT